MKWYACITIISVCVFLSCSTKKDTVLSRSSHALSTEFNILHNGNFAFDKGKNILYQDYKDNYWDVLPIEKLNIDPDIYLFERQVKISEFERSENKATKGIQRHAMNIAYRERNPQTDEAFLLLGKSRYFTQRFIPAQNAFNYILYHYPDSNILPEAKLWREKVNLRLGNAVLAIKNLKKLFYQEILQRETYSEAMATMAQAYQNLKNIDSTIVCLKIATEITKQQIKGRYHYILGQLYEQKKDTFNAINCYDKVVKLNYNTNRYHVIHAILNNLTLRKHDENDEVLKKIQKLKNTYENRSFLDIINYRLASYYKEHQNIIAAKNTYQEAVKNSQDKLLKAYAYEQIANLCFQENYYAESGKYYDSTLIHIPKTHERFFSIKKRRDKLKNIVIYEKIVKKNDSIIKLIKLSKKNKKNYFQNYINTLKYHDSILQIKISNQFNKKTSKGGFYFYNENQVKQGKLTFQKLWNRSLKQGWNINGESKRIISFGSEKNQKNREVKLGKYDINYYLKTLPKNKILDSIELQINNAYYQLGIIYNDQFQNFELSKSRLEKLLNNHPQSHLDLLGKYYLYKLYNTHQKQDDAKIIKQQILKQYPNSQIADILLGKNHQINEHDSKLLKSYKEIFDLFQKEDFDAVISKCKSLHPIYQEEKIAPKFEIIKAFAIGRLHSIDLLATTLKSIADSYRYTNESKWIRGYIANAIPAIQKRDFKKYQPDDHWKLIFPVDKKDKTTIDAIEKKLRYTFDEMNYSHLKISTDRYNDQTICLVVHGISSFEKTMGLQELLKINPNFKIKQDNFIISSGNYELILFKKNLEEYRSKIDFLLL